MLKELTLTNFKSFASEPQTIPFAPVTVFVGANGSGKSNALDAVRFLQGLGLKLPIAAALSGASEGGQEIHPGIRGGLTEACWFGEHWFQIATRVQIDSTDPLWESLYSSESLTELRQSNGLVHEVRVSIGEQHLLELESLAFAGHAGRLLFRTVADQSTPGTLTIESGSEKLWFARDVTGHAASNIAARFPSIPVSTREIIEIFLAELAGFRFLDLRPSMMRDYVPFRQPELGSTGENVSAVLYRIHHDSKQHRRLVEWLSALAAPAVSDIKFDMTSLGDVLLQLAEDGPHPRDISARSLSDGILRFIGYLAAVFSAPPGSVVLVEEIENGLHPTRVHLLVELFEQLAEARRIQIVATTHSPMVLLGLSEAALRSAVLFARVEDYAGTIVRQLGELPHFDEVRKGSQIDKLFTTGWLEFAV